MYSNSLMRVLSVGEAYTEFYKGRCSFKGDIDKIVKKFKDEFKVRKGSD